MASKTPEISKTERHAPGCYTLHTPLGRVGILHYAPRDGDRAEWFITYPGESTPGDVTSTLKDAKSLVTTWLEMELPREARYEELV